MSWVETIVTEPKTLSRAERQTEQAFLRLGAVLAEVARSSQARQPATRPEPCSVPDTFPEAQLPKPGEETNAAQPQKRTTYHSGHPSRRKGE